MNSSHNRTAAAQTAPAAVDFSQGAVWRAIIRQAVPLTVAQLVHLLYNVVDRIYIGHMGGQDSLALTGVGLTFPIITLIMAFSALFGMGGVPLFSIARGADDEQKAAGILGNSCSLLIVSSVILTVCGYLFRRPVLYAFGASDASYIFADQYLRVYLAGTVFSMLATGLNGYINAQGFPKTGMLSIIIGAAVNIALDPVFIFLLGMGVAGAALASVISQIISSLWVLNFLVRKAPIRITAGGLRLRGSVTGGIMKFGVVNFIMQGTNVVVQAACNSTLQKYGGDLYVGIMTVTNSIREITMLPVSGLISGAMPVLSFNFGAKKYDRVREGIRFNTAAGFVYTLAAWLLILVFPAFWFGVFSDDARLAAVGAQALRIYFFGFVFMALQFSGQSTFQSVGDAKHAIFFSLLRKVIIVVPLTFLLPAAGMGVNGVFAAEPVSNIIGGLASFLTMRFTVYRNMELLE